MKEYVNAERVLNKENIPLDLILKIVTCDECKYCVNGNLCAFTNTWVPKKHFCARGVEE